MDREVARTLGELELKLRELERELTSIGRRATEPPPISPPPPISQPVPPQPHSPAPPTPTAAQGQSAVTPSRLVDEAVEAQGERRYSMETQQTAFGEIPATKDERETIDLAELVQFRERMLHTLQGLIDEYSRLLSLRPPSGD